MTEQHRNAKADAKAAKAYAKASRPFYKKKRFIIPAALVAVIAIASAGGAGGSGGSDEPASASSSSGGGAEASKPEKTMKVDAGTVIKDYEKNEAAADGKYDGKLLEVSGVIEKVDTEVWDDEKYVVMVGAGGAWDFLTVDCPGQSADAVSSLNKGDDVTVRGEFDDGGDLGVTLKDCSVVG